MYTKCTCGVCVCILWQRFICQSLSLVVSEYMYSSSTVMYHSSSYYYYTCINVLLIIITRVHVRLPLLYSVHGPAGTRRYEGTWGIPQSHGQPHGWWDAATKGLPPANTTVSAPFMFVILSVCTCVYLHSYYCYNIMC